MNERHRQKRIALWHYVLALPRSVWYNYRWLPRNQAKRLPILVSHRTVVENCSGSVELQAKDLRVGLVKIGFSTYQQSDFRYDRTRLNIRGRLLLKGESDVGAGCAIAVGENGVLSMDERSHVGPKSLVICHKLISLGRRARLSWCCTLMDTDQHELVDADGVVRNNDRPIVLGENVWVGCNVLMTKGTEVADNNTVGAGSVLHGCFKESNTVIAGNPAQVVKRGVKRNN